MGFLLSACQPRSRLLQQPSREDGKTLVPFVFFDKALRTCSLALCPTCHLRPGFALSITFQALAMTRVPSLLHDAPFLWNLTHAIYLSRTLFPTVIPPHFSKPGVAITASKQPFFTLPPSPAIAPWRLYPAALPPLRPFVSFHICLLCTAVTLLGADCIIFLLPYTQHIGKELAPSKHSIHNCWENI